MCAAPSHFRAPISHTWQTARETRNARLHFRGRGGWMCAARGHVNCPIVLTTGPVWNETGDIGSAITAGSERADNAHCSIPVSTPGEPYMNKTVWHACEIIYNSAHNGAALCPARRGFRGIKELNLRHGMQIMERFIIIIIHSSTHKAARVLRRHCWTICKFNPAA